MNSAEREPTPSDSVAAANLLADWRQRVETVLASTLQSHDAPSRLLDAMRHGTLGGGKRMRALLVYASGHLFGAAPESLDHAACAVELIHAYSLIHDDLPAMDDDDLRRGRPTVHVAFDEATAILAGDALQALAFQILAEAPQTTSLRVELLRELAVASGAAGMCGGQAIDLAATGQQIDLDELQRMHALKTGALIQAAVAMGAICAGANDAAMTALRDFARSLGLAFQIRDDILDVESSSEALGKTVGKDARADKPTYVSLLGVEAAREVLDGEHRRMLQVLQNADFDASLRQPLEALALMTVQRAY